MGSLQNFNDTCEKIKFLKKANGSSVFVETGCFRGNSLRYALELGFDKLYSCDVDLEMVNHCLIMFKDKPVDIFHGNSIDYLTHLLPKLEDVDSVIFYLDAHLPEHDKNDGKKIIETEFNFPLQGEIEIINKFRGSKNDVIICDDLRIYEDGPFEGGIWTERKRFGLDLSFLSHYNYSMNKFYSQEGYLLLTKVIAV